MIALGSDHGGFDLKCEIMEHLKERGLEYKDYGWILDVMTSHPVIIRILQSRQQRRLQRAAVKEGSLCAQQELGSPLRQTR